MPKAKVHIRFDRDIIHTIDTVKGELRKKGINCTVENQRYLAIDITVAKAYYKKEKDLLKHCTRVGIMIGFEIVKAKAESEGFGKIY